MLSLPAASVPANPDHLWFGQAEVGFSPNSAEMSVCLHQGMPGCQLSPCKCRQAVCQQILLLASIWQVQSSTTTTCIMLCEQQLFRCLPKRKRAWALQPGVQSGSCQTESPPAACLLCHLFLQHHSSVTKHALWLDRHVQSLLPDWL